MAEFIIEGGKKLEGEIEVYGMKNAATAILAASLLTNEPCILENIPRILDIENLIKLLKSLGSEIAWTSSHTLWINNRNLRLSNLDKKLIQSMRSSVLLIAPLLKRFKKIFLPEPGGCIIGNRPLNTHFYALKKIGIKVLPKNSGYQMKAQRLLGTTVILPEFSVTATENLIMLASQIQGTTVIKLAAAEPHVQDLCGFLKKMGAKIEGVGTHTLVIKGVKRLKGIRYRIIPDQIEAGTFAVLGALAKGYLSIKGINFQHLDIILLKLEEIGVKFKIKSRILEIYPSSSLRAFKLQTLPYPGFPTDLQAPFGVLATQCQGTSLIQDPLYEGRMSYVQELVKMGANAVVCDPHRVLITGPTPLYGREIKSPDLRAGATLILAGLVAQGETRIQNAEVIDRGYESLEIRLQKLGAKIKRIYN